MLLNIVNVRPDIQRRVVDMLDSLNTTPFGSCVVSAQCMIACTEASSN